MRARYRPGAGPRARSRGRQLRLAEARAEAQRWIDEGREHSCGRRFCLRAGTSPRRTRASSRAALRSTALPERGAHARRPPHRYLRDDRPAARRPATSRQPCGVVSGQCARRLGAVLDLLTHPSARCRSWAATSAVARGEAERTAGGDLTPDKLAHALCGHRRQAARRAADESLLERRGPARRLARHPLADLRNAVRPVIAPEPQRPRRFTGRLAELLLATLSCPKPPRASRASHAAAEDLTGDGGRPR